MSHTPTIPTRPQGRTVAVVGDVYRFLGTGEDTAASPPCSRRMSEARP